jgi:hypothetical protein
MHTRGELNKSRSVARAQNSEVSSVDPGRGKAKPADMTLLEGCGVEMGGLLPH